MESISAFLDIAEFADSLSGITEPSLIVVGYM